MRLEYDTLVRMGCRDIVDIPSDTMLLGVRWVLKIKMIENARLVVKVYIQQQDVHYPQSCSPTISQVSLCIVMVLTSMKGFRSWDLDTTSVLVSAPLPEGETGYMEQIPGFPFPKGKCLKLKRTLYGVSAAADIGPCVSLCQRRCRHRSLCQRRCRREKRGTWSKFQVFRFLKASV